MTNLYIGTAGWSYKDWVPSFYPKGQTLNFDWLNYYSNYFNSVEVNATYYTYLSPKTAEGWLKKTSDKLEFKFTIKLHQDFTHKKIISVENSRLVKENLNILSKGGKLGGLLIQFPYSFGFNEEAINYISRLKEIFQDFPIIIEVRHNSWNKSQIFDYFRAEDLSFCIIDQPQISKSISFNLVVTNNVLYLRLHGRNAKAWFDSFQDIHKKQSYDEQSERYNYLYSPGELLEIKNKIIDVKNQVNIIYIIFNNHPHGNAIANAFEMLQFLNDNKIIEIPQTILKSFPRIKSIKQ
jgi:uncharacterized protein YecE (DUF72 family)